MLVGFSYGAPSVMAAAALALQPAADRALMESLGHLAGVVTLGCGMRVRSEGELVDVGRRLKGGASRSTAQDGYGGCDSQGFVEAFERASLPLCMLHGRPGGLCRHLRAGARTQDGRVAPRRGPSHAISLRRGRGHPRGVVGRLAPRALRGRAPRARRPRRRPHTVKIQLLVILSVEYNLLHQRVYITERRETLSHFSLSPHADGSRIRVLLVYGKGCVPCIWINHPKIRSISTFGEVFELFAEACRRLKTFYPLTIHDLRGTNTRSVLHRGILYRHAELLLVL